MASTSYDRFYSPSQSAYSPHNYNHYHAAAAPRSMYPQGRNDYSMSPNMYPQNQSGYGTPDYAPPDYAPPQYSPPQHRPSPYSPVSSPSPVSPYSQQSCDGPLPAPIVIPQQRPGSKDRGFMAAYAPSLEKAGVDRATMLQLIDDVNNGLQGNKYLAGVQVVALGAGFAPGMIAFAVTTAVQMGAGAANSFHVKHKTNGVLDKYNKEIFEPLGLYCMIMKYEPQNPDVSDYEAQQSASRNQSPFSKLGSMVQSPNSGNNTWTRNPVSGTVQGDHGLPMEVAPLMYIEDRRKYREALAASREGSSSPDSARSPELESAPHKASAKDKCKAKFDQFNDYLDRRARVRYAAENSNSALNVPVTKGFSNRFLDPNHAATNNGLIGLISGGMITRDPEARKESKYKRIHEEEQRTLDEYHQRLDSIRNQRQSPRETERQMRRVEEDYAPRLAQFREQRKDVAQDHRHIKDVLYLTIVNRPSDAAMAAASAKLGQYQNAGMVMGQNV